MSKATRSRVLLLRSFLVAVRSAVRPGSPGMGQRFAAVPRMVRAAIVGEYRGLSRGRVALFAGAVAYLLSPIDLLPEAILPLIGLADDAVVLAWLAAALVTETERFLQWEYAMRNPVPGWVVREGGAGTAAR